MTDGGLSLDSAEVRALGPKLKQLVRAAATARATSDPTAVMDAGGMDLVKAIQKVRRAVPDTDGPTWDGPADARRVGP